MAKVFYFLKKVFLWVLISHLLYVLYVWILPPPITLTQIQSLLSGNGLHKSWASHHKLGPSLPLAVMAAEDQVFPDHDGFDWKSIEKAMKYNKRKPGRVRGASTLSQQVAKNVFLWQGRSWIRKGLEVYFTFLIETLYSKRRIITLYLNEAEMGRGIFGAKAASKNYFNKLPAQLSRLEAAQIAACLPNPKKYTVRPLSRYVSIRSGWVLRQMSNLDSDPDVQAIIGTAPRRVKTNHRP